MDMMTTCPSLIASLNQTDRSNYMDCEKIQNAVREALVAIGEDPRREGLADTPRRIAEMYGELFSGIGKDPASALTTDFDEGCDETAILRDVPFHSICERHFLPFFGAAHIACMPTGRVAGASKLARALDILASRPQIQERLTSQLADALYDTLQPTGAAVVMSAERMRMSIRGARKPGSKIVATAARGNLKDQPTARQDPLALLRETQ